MNCPHCDISALNSDGLERIAICRDCKGGWLSARTGGVVYRDNLIYLPFANHLSKEDAAAEEFAKAA